MPTVVSDYSAILGYLENDAMRWNGVVALGTPVVVSYSFLETTELPVLAEGTTGSLGATGYATWTPDQRAAMRAVMDSLEAIAGVVFVEVDGNAMIDYYSAVGASGASGYSGVPFSSFRYSGTTTTDFVMIYQDFSDGFTNQVLYHELGHAMGLLHPHDGQINLSAEADTQENTAMTYNGQYPYGSQWGAFDIQALTELYGDPSGTQDLSVTVKPSGQVRIIAGQSSEVLLATVEGADVHGRGGDDSIYGRDGNDILRGQGGSDTIWGDYGNDLVIGGTEADTIFGDRGTYYSGDNDRLIGSAGDDVIFGDGGDDTLIGGADNDRLDGGYGDDRLIGGAGADVLIGGRGADVYVGGAGADRFVMTTQDYDGLQDRIVDFQDGIDLIDLSTLGRNASNIYATQWGSNTHVFVNYTGIEFILVGVSASDISGDDFIFV